MKKVVLILCCLWWVSCDVEPQEDWSLTGMGEAGDIAVFTTEGSWEVYDSLVDGIFGRRLPGLVSNEPYFKIRESG